MFGQSTKITEVVSTIKFISMIHHHRDYMDLSQNKPFCFPSQCFNKNSQEKNSIVCKQMEFYRCLVQILENFFQCLKSDV